MLFIILSCNIFGRRMSPSVWDRGYYPEMVQPFYLTLQSQVRNSLTRGANIILASHFLQNQRSKRQNGASWLDIKTSKTLKYTTQMFLIQVAFVKYLLIDWWNVCYLLLLFRIGSDDALFDDVFVVVGCGTSRKRHHVVRVSLLEFNQNFLCLGLHLWIKY